MISQNFYSHGKLLITAEYLVLDGALALALPTQKGQSLSIEPSQESGILWDSIDHKDDCWFKTNLSYSQLENFSLKNTATPSVQDRLLQILAEAKKLNPEFLKEEPSIFVRTKLDFVQNWGLGSSSTLIANVAKWAEIDAYKLLENTFGGSGYDIACAQNDNPLLYQLVDRKPQVLLTSFNKPFLDKLFFIHLNRKQNSRDSIKHYREQPQNNIVEAVKKISGLTESILNSNSLNGFNMLLDTHETLLSSILKTPTIKSRLFSDYSGSVKSLGGWGGDFILATGSVEDMDYFREKGFSTIVPFSEMVLN
tara:strand:- start:703 stop:1629 length:927 start_codon:yes stop_codon:yes gene_type:complete